MRMSAAVKGAGTLAVVIFSWVTHTLSPLFWVLLGLVILDLLLHMHKGMQQQWSKLWAATAALGLPTYLATNSAKVMAFNPDVLKVVVAALCIGYVQVVLPDIVGFVGKLKLSKNQGQNAADVAMLQATIQELTSRLDKQAEATIAQAGVGPITTSAPAPAVQAPQTGAQGS